MKQGSVGMLPRRGSIVITNSLLFVLVAGTMDAACAADVQINTPPGGNFVVKDNAGATMLLKVDGSGPVTVPNLLTAPTYATGVCFDGSGVLGQCASIVGPAGPAGAAGPAGPAGAAGAAGPAGAAGTNAIVEYADFFALMPGDNAGTVAVGADVSFPQSGPTSAGGITRTSPSTFNLATVGTYQIMFQVSVDEAGQLVLGLNSGAGVVEQLNTVVGRATGTSQIVGMSLVTTTAVNSILTVRNSSATALTVTASVGVANPLSAHLVITRLQ